MAPPAGSLEADLRLLVSAASTVTTLSGRPPAPPSLPCGANVGGTTRLLPQLPQRPLRGGLDGVHREGVDFLVDIFDAFGSVDHLSPWGRQKKRAVNAFTILGVWGFQSGRASRRVQHTFGAFTDTSL